MDTSRVFKTARGLARRLRQLRATRRKDRKRLLSGRAPRRALTPRQREEGLREDRRPLPYLWRRDRPPKGGGPLTTSWPMPWAGSMKCPTTSPPMDHATSTGVPTDPRSTSGSRSWVCGSGRRSRTGPPPQWRSLRDLSAMNGVDRSGVWAPTRKSTRGQAEPGREYHVPV